MLFKRLAHGAELNELPPMHTPKEGYTRPVWHLRARQEMERSPIVLQALHQAPHSSCLQLEEVHRSTLGQISRASSKSDGRASTDKFCSAHILSLLNRRFLSYLHRIWSQNNKSAYLAQLQIRFTHCSHINGLSNEEEWPFLGINTIYLSLYDSSVHDVQHQSKSISHIKLLENVTHYQEKK